jgi:hypothetical protein
LPVVKVELYGCPSTVRKVAVCSEAANATL